MVQGANRVVEVLSRTGGFSTKVARHRLFETTQHILQCTRSLESIQPGGEGHASSVRVRLLHAAVRQKITCLAKRYPSYYDIEKLGTPINALDCIATIGTFSATLIWLSLPRQGIFMRKQEIIDYIALFRYIAYITGTETEYFETPEKARAVMETLLLTEINPSETSKILASNVLSALADQPPNYASKEFLEVCSRWLNGNELCDALGLGRPGLYYWILMAGQCLFFMTICYTYRSIGWLDRRKIKVCAFPQRISYFNLTVLPQALRKIFWTVIVKGKQGLQGETSFDFKYVPDVHKITTLEAVSKPGLKDYGTERRNLHAFIIACTLFTLIAYTSLCFLKQLLGSNSGDVR